MSAQVGCALNLMKLNRYCLLAIAALCIAATDSYASGSYNARPPRPPRVDDRDSTDRDKYALGKQIFNGKAKLVAQPAVDRTAQEKRLRDLQARLPEKVQKETNLPAMAGQLSPAQLDALEHYVSKRYPSK